MEAPWKIGRRRAGDDGVGARIRPSAQRDRGRWRRRSSCGGWLLPIGGPSGAVPQTRGAIRATGLVSGATGGPHRLGPRRAPSETHATYGYRMTLPLDRPATRHPECPVAPADGPGPTYAIVRTRVPLPAAHPPRRSAAPGHWRDGHRQHDLGERDRGGPHRGAGGRGHRSGHRPRSGRLPAQGPDDRGGPQPPSAAEEPEDGRQTPWRGAHPRHPRV